MQAIAVPPAVAVTCWSNVKVLHAPLKIRVLLVKSEPHGSAEQTAGYSNNQSNISIIYVALII